MDDVCVPAVGVGDGNSSVDRRTNASPASILFGKKLDLNRGILTPHLLPTLTSSNPTYITDLIEIQDKVLSAAILLRNVVINTGSPHRV